MRSTYLLSNLLGLLIRVLGLQCGGPNFESSTLPLDGQSVFNGHKLHAFVYIVQSPACKELTFFVVWQNRLLYFGVIIGNFG